jgi:hypothetical protein
VRVLLKQAGLVANRHTHFVVDTPAGARGAPGPP